MEKLKPCTLLVGMQNGAQLQKKNSMELPQKLKNRTYRMILDSNFWIFIQKKKVGTPIFTAALYRTAKSREQPQCLSTDARDRRRDQHSVICTMDHHSVLKRGRNSDAVCQVLQMKLKNKMHRKMSHKDEYRMVPLTGDTQSSQIQRHRKHHVG